MYLYNKENNMIDVYKMTSNIKKSAEYKKNEMEKNVPFEERILKATTNDVKELETKNNPISWNKLQSEENGFYGGIFFHNISSYDMNEEEQLRQQQLLQRYYNGDFSTYSVSLIQKYNDKKVKFEIIKYFLLTQSYYEKYQTSQMDNIISIPKSLYLLQLLEQGRFNQVVDEDISMQLQTFDISSTPIERISLEELKKMYDYRLLPGCFKGTMGKVETTQKILSKMR